jgi:sugar lactone lactonase YvrE
MPSRTNPTRLFVALLLSLLTPLLRAQTQTIATTVPLILPGGLAYDAAGNLYFAETGNHVVRRVTPAGILTTVAGTGVQGFAGDGAAATAALLDSPSSVALDAAGDLFIADAHNHRIRRVDAISGIITTFAGTGATGASPNGTPAASALLDMPSAMAFDPSQNLIVADQHTHVLYRIDHLSGAISTIAGNGTQGYDGDLGPATLASIDSPTGIAVDASGNIFLADTHNQRIRRVDAASRIITSVAGTGQPGFAGDNASASAAMLNLPRGLALDPAGNLYLTDTRNQRIRRIDAVTGQITTVAGEGTQTFAGDGGPAIGASFDTPGAVTISPGGLPTLADTSNQRVRQIDVNANIDTIAGLGTTIAGTLMLSGPAVTRYGTGSLTATLATSPATGSVTFFDTVANRTQTLATAALVSNAASLSTSSMPAGVYSFSATYAGDTLHSAAQSSLLKMTISPAPVVATPAAVSLVYGQPIPALTCSLAGVLPQDSSSITLALSSPAAALSAPGSYPITAAISGSAAGNYTLTQTAAAVTIAQAPTTISLSNSLAVHVSSTTTSIPTGQVNLFDASTLYASATLSPTGDAAFFTSSLSTGTHTLTAAYPGSINFLSASSTPQIVTIGTSSASPDFALAATGQTTVAVPAGSAAQFSFAVTPLNGALTGPIQLAASGLPSGATASFNPAYLPPANTPAAFVLTIQTPKTASLEYKSPWVFALLAPLLMFARKRRPRVLLVGAFLLLCVGCGDRINNSAATSASVSYNITVTATATSTSGATLQHTAGVVLTLQ